MSKKEHILEKAEALFAQKGYDAASVRDIAKAANVNIAMISYYFGSKEKLIEAVFKSRMEQGYNYTTGILQDDSITPIEKIEKLIDGYVHKVRNNQKFYCVVLAEQMVNNNKKIVTLLEGSRRHFLSVYEKVIADGIKAKMFKYNPDPVLLMTTVTGTLMQCLLNKKFYEEYHNISIKTAADEATYFDAVGNHLKTTFKRLLGYEENK